VSTSVSGRADVALVEVADGVHAYVQPPGGWCVSNAGVINTPDGTVVVDTLATERRTRALRAFVDQVSTAPNRILVNTHHHGDHTLGNHLVGAQTIIAHDRAPAEMAETGLALTALWPGVDWGDARVTLPTVTFSARMTLHLGERHVELIHLGVAHTTNDVVVWLPAERVLFAGDVVLSGAAPFSLFGSVAGTISAIARLRRLEPATVVCGHGPVGGVELLDRNVEYLRWVEALAAEGVAAGRTPLEVARDADLDRFADLIDPERIAGNLHRAYAERAGVPAGAPLDVLEVFAEMVALNGGEPPSCLA
jgi:cyclase